MKRQILFLIFSVIFIFSSITKVLASDEVLEEGKKLPRLKVTEFKKVTIFPDDFNGKVFALYFGNLVDNQDGFQFLSWAGGFTVILRQENKDFKKIYFAGIASLKDRPVYWIPPLVRKTFSDEMKKHEISGALFYDWDGIIADKLKLKPGEIRAIIVDKRGIIRKVYDSKIYDLPKEEIKIFTDLIRELMNEDISDDN